MWGLKHVLSYYVRQERGNITLEYRLPLSQGLKDCMSKYEVIIPTEAVRTELSPSYTHLFLLLYLLLCSLLYLPCLTDNIIGWKKFSHSRTDIVLPD